MDKAHILLRLARIDAGWTQEELAAELNVSSMTVYRWEHGQRLPNSSHRARLCAVLRLSEAELGWSEAGDPPDASVVGDPLIPFSSSILLGQHALLQTMQAQCHHRTHRTLGLVGMAGSGKTALAATLASLLLRRQTSGVLWANVGPTASTPWRHLQRWAMLLGLETLPADLEEAKDRIRVAIGGRHLLLILDDVWSENDVEMYQVGGPFCQYLLTTPLTSLAHRHCDWIARPQLLDASQALTLLKRGLPPTFVQRYRSALRKIAEQAGSVPLVLTAVSRFLREAASTDSPRRIQHALAQLTRPACSLRLPAPAHDSMASRIQRCEQGLSIPARQALQTLASHIAPAPATFTERQALTLLREHELHLWDLDQIVDMNLIQAVGHSYQLPPVVATYLRLGLEHDVSYSSHS